MLKRCVFSSDGTDEDKAAEFSSFVVLSCTLVSETLQFSNKQDREVAAFPLSSAHYKSSFMPSWSGSVNVEAGVVAGQWKAPLRLCLHCCPLVNDRAVGSESFVYTVIKHSKPPGWQQAHSLAPGHSVENKTHLMLCFPAPRDPTPEERQSIKGTEAQVFLLKVHLCLHTQVKKSLPL